MNLKKTDLGSLSKILSVAMVIAVVEVVEAAPVVYQLYL